MNCSDNLKAIIDCINANPQTEKHQRIIRTIIYYVHTQYNADKEYKEIKLFELFSLETAMEIILGGTKNRNNFLEKLFVKLFPDWEKDGEYEIYKENNKTKIKTLDPFLSEFFNWAQSFYELRNKVFHGSEIKDTDETFNGHHHIMIAREVLADLIDKSLENIGLFKRYNKVRGGNFYFKKYFKEKYDNKYETKKHLDDNPALNQAAQNCLNSLNSAD